MPSHASLRAGAEIVHQPDPSEPVESRGDSRRVPLLDALRGAALFGVLLVNMMWFAGYDNSVTAEQFSGLPTARLDAFAEEAIDMLLFAKALGVFAFLFGVGFAMQMERWRSRSASTIVYRRRIAGLFAIGVLHWLAWSGDILHVYALAASLLAFATPWSNKSLVAVGIPVAILARPILGRLPSLAGASSLLPEPADTPVYRHDVFLGGNAVAVIATQWRQDCLPHVASGALLAAVCHALGRFMVGVAAARGGWLTQPERYRGQMRLVAIICLPVGLVAQRDWWVADGARVLGLHIDPTTMSFLRHVTNSIGVVSMTAAYVAAFVLLWQFGPARQMAMRLVPLGRTALTNYLMQTVIGYALFFGFGLGLMGRVGAAACVLLAVVIYAAQVALSGWWMSRFCFGPVEWLWRWWTYNQRPPFIRLGSTQT